MLVSAGGRRRAEPPMTRVLLVRIAFPLCSFVLLSGTAPYVRYLHDYNRFEDGSILEEYISDLQHCRVASHDGFCIVLGLKKL